MIAHPQVCPLCGEIYCCPPAKGAEIITLICGECEEAGHAADMREHDVIYTRTVTVRVKAQIPATAGAAATFDALRDYARALPVDPYQSIVRETIERTTDHV